MWYADASGARCELKSKPSNLLLPRIIEHDEAKWICPLATVVHLAVVVLVLRRVEAGCCKALLHELGGVPFAKPAHEECGTLLTLNARRVQLKVLIGWLEAAVALLVSSCKERGQTLRTLAPDEPRASRAPQGYMGHIIVCAEPRQVIAQVHLAAANLVN